MLWVLLSGCVLCVVGCTRDQSATIKFVLCRVGVCTMSKVLHSPGTKERPRQAWANTFSCYSVGRLNRRGTATTGWHAERIKLQCLPKPWAARPGFAETP